MTFFVPWLSGLWAERKEAAFLHQGRLVVSRLPKQQAAQAADWVQDLSDFAWHSLDLIRNPVFNCGTFIQDTDKLDKVQRGALRWLVTICKQQLQGWGFLSLKQIASRAVNCILQYPTGKGWKRRKCWAYHSRPYQEGKRQKSNWNRKFLMDIRNNFFPPEGRSRVRAGYRERLCSPPLEILKTIWCDLTSDLPSSKRLDQRPPYILSSLKDSVLL